MAAISKNEAIEIINKSLPIVEATDFEGLKLLHILVSENFIAPLKPLKDEESLINILINEVLKEKLKEREKK